jgi:hypothetical protein
MPGAGAHADDDFPLRRRRGLADDDLAARRRGDHHSRGLGVNGRGRCEAEKRHEKDRKKGSAMHDHGILQRE